VKAISVLNPWAVLLAIGAKTYETRSWVTPYRGPIAIHASKKFGGVEQAIAFSEPFFEVLKREMFKEFFAESFRTKYCGAVLATGELTGCFATEAIAHTLSDQEKAFGDFRRGRFAWRIENVKLLETPVACKGRLGLWEWNG